ncbi:MAG: ABC transporter permease [Chloroflexota bacterium]|jgi:ribose transport system permease protein
MADEDRESPARAAGEPMETGSGTGEMRLARDPIEARRKVSVPETTALFLVLVVLLAFFSVFAPYFIRDPSGNLTADNLINILQNAARIGIIACPATLLMISGQFDLSVGSIAAFTAMVMALAAAPTGGLLKLPMAFGLPIELAVVIAILFAVLVGVINGICVTVFRINALITTLGTLAIFRGLTKVLGDAQTIRIDGFGALGTTRILGLPIPVYIFAIVVVVFFVILRYTTYGRSMYAIGASPTAARLAGIRTKRAVFIAFLMSAGLAGLAGLILLSQVGGASVTADIGLELSVVTAVVLGGTSLSGGRGGIVGTILAVLIIGVLGNGLVQMRIQPFWIDVANGLLLLIAVGFDQLRVRLTSSID